MSKRKCIIISLVLVLTLIPVLVSASPGSVEAREQAGCTPGFWKNHTDCWENYETSAKVWWHFAVPAELADLADDTFLDALSYRGGRGIEGAARNLLRHAVAALLNQGHSDVGYPMLVFEIKDGVSQALASLDRGEMLALKDILDGFNNLGCGIDAHCESCD